MEKDYKLKKEIEEFLLENREEILFRKEISSIHNKVVEKRKRRKRRKK